VRHAFEHAIYIMETDGYLFDRFKAYYSGGYGVLTFVEDHGVIQNCDAAGHGDSGIYPGSGAETGAQGVREGYESRRRYNQEIRRCDMHHSTLGYSGTDANGIWVHHNNFYDNSMGFSTDIFTASGHPGFPQDSDLIEHNNFYDNNFNAYDDKSDVKPSVPVPVGTGGWIAGGNDNIVRHNRFYDNWRRAWMLFAVPDAFVCTQKDENNLHGCDPTETNTSFRNVFFGNVMGVAPDGSYKPNGQDFWWDGFSGNTGNCWYKNTTAAGHSLNNYPSPLPDCDNGKAPQTSMGTTPLGEPELVGCLVQVEDKSKRKPDAGPCPWFNTPAKPSGR
jgi:hypothetical protein